MIEYDSMRVCTLFRFHGSVFPRAALCSIVPSGVSVLIHVMVDRRVWEFNKTHIIRDSAAFASFSFVLGFLLVFRSDHCYKRFWMCTSEVATMRAQMLEAASGLVSFASMSKKSAAEVDTYRQLVLRLVSLWHALALNVLTEQENEDYPVLDLRGLDPEKLKGLRFLDGRCQVDAVYSWLNVLIMDNIANGLLNIPPPILSRVFQELEKAMIQFNAVMQVMDIPFPFQYVQLSVILVVIWACLSPLMIAMWSGHWSAAFLFTFLGNMCFVSLEMISNELDQPFGDDPNDLPAMSFQHDINKSLLMLMHPLVQTYPRLNSRAKRTHPELEAGQQSGWSSLKAEWAAYTPIETTDTDNVRVLSGGVDHYVSC